MIFGPIAPLMCNISTWWSDKLRAIVTNKKVLMSVAWVLLDNNIISNGNVIYHYHTWRSDKQRTMVIHRQANDSGSFS